MELTQHHGPMLATMTLTLFPAGCTRPPPSHKGGRVIFLDIKLNTKKILSDACAFADGHAPRRAVPC